MRIEQLQAKRAHAARVALAKGLGALRSSRSEIAKIAKRWHVADKAIVRALNQYERAGGEDRPDIATSTRALIEELKTPIETAVEDLRDVFAIMTKHEKRLKRFKARKRGRT
jgi:hypothetical protein